MEKVMKRVTMLMIMSTWLCSSYSMETPQTLDYESCRIMDNDISKFPPTTRPRSVHQIIGKITDEGKVSLLNLSDNYITSKGAKQLTSWLKDDHLPNLQELNLSYNRIQSDIMPDFEELLQRNNFKYLNIVGNPAASIDSKEYFNTLCLESLLKIIWIPEALIEEENWKTIIAKRLEASPYDKGGIIHAHKSYYNNKKSPLRSTLEDKVDINEIKKNAKGDILARFGRKVIQERILDNFLKKLDSSYNEELAKAARELGLLYLTNSLNKTLPEAVECLYFAAKLGDADAMYHLSKLYKEGKGVNFDTEGAKKLLNKAADLGCYQALKERGDIEEIYTNPL